MDNQNENTLQIEISIADEYAAYIEWLRRKEFEEKERERESMIDIDSNNNNGVIIIQMFA